MSYSTKKYSAVNISIMLVLSLFQSSCSLENKSDALTHYNKSLSNQSVSDELTSKEIVKSVRGYWESSLEGDQSKVKSYIQKAPNEFWIRCSNKGNEMDISSSHQSESKVGEGSLISENEKQSTMFLLEYFSDQIAQGKPELIDVNVARLTSNAGVVRIKWRKKGTISPEFNEVVLLQKFNKEWKIIMMQNGVKYENIFRVFGTNETCKY
jgi:hypothetical protein